VNDIYNAFFSRNAEIGGLNYYVNGFNTGWFTPATIMLDILYGAQNEDLQSINNKVAASNLFTRTIDPELDGNNFQVTYAGNSDVIEARNFLSFVTWNSSTVPTQEETTIYMQRYIADPGDPIMNGGSEGDRPEECADISGYWNGSETASITCCAENECESETFSGTGEIFIEQNGCDISYNLSVSGMGIFTRIGTIDGNRMQLSGVAVVLAPGCIATRNTVNFTGTVDGDRIEIKGPLDVQGSCDDYTFSCTGSSTAILSR
jgi:hypothetical protein